MAAMAVMAAMAGSVSNLQVSPEFNVFEFNQKGISLHFNLDIANARGTRCWVRGSIPYPNKAPVVARTRVFANSQGGLSNFKEFVPRQWMSNGKRKGAGNKKNSNKYLAWAYSEAADYSRRFYPEPRAYYNRKVQKTNSVVAHSQIGVLSLKSTSFFRND